MLKRLCVISQYYPTETDPILSFVDELVTKIADKGVECIVITPISLIENKHKQATRTKVTPNGNKIRIICPRFTMWPNRTILGKQTFVLSIDSFCKSALAAFRKHVGKADVIYGHFLSMSGIAAAYIGKMENTKAVVACGESDLKQNIDIYNKYRSLINELQGIISVSSKIKKDLVDYKIYSYPEKIVVLPNGIDLKCFKPIEKRECRLKLGIEESDTVAIFVGHFITRKGINNVINALNRIGNIKGIFIGGDKLPNECKNAIIVKKVPHSELPIYYNASDIFVLPTLNEGCCNAILEAQACGLPIITSDREFNYDIISSDNGMLIDPNSVDELIDAITTLRDDFNLRNTLSRRSIQLSKERDIDKRARLIISFLENL